MTDFIIGRYDRPVLTIILGFNFDDDSNLPDLKSNDWSTQNFELQESLQQQRDREREQRLAREENIARDHIDDNNMLDLIMDI